MYTNKRLFQNFFRPCLVFMWWVGSNEFYLSSAWHFLWFNSSPSAAFLSVYEAGNWIWIERKPWNCLNPVTPLSGRTKSLYLTVLNSWHYHYHGLVRRGLVEEFFRIKKLDRNLQLKLASMLTISNLPPLRYFPQMKACMGALALLHMARHTKGKKTHMSRCSISQTR